jgi:Protein of unknown function (DUF2934)
MEPSITTPETTPMDLEEHKRRIAYELWENEGRPEGKAEEHWNQACLVVMSLQDETSPDWLQRQEAAATPIMAKTAESKKQTAQPIDVARRRLVERSAA